MDERPMPRVAYYDFDGNEMPDVVEWARYYDRIYAEGKVNVEVTPVGEKYVSTAFQGHDLMHGFGPVPMIFETMIFPECNRFGVAPNVEIARKVHQEAVEQLLRDRGQEN